jgi:hypothetical protein
MRLFTEGEAWCCDDRVAEKLGVTFPPLGVDNPFHANEINGVVPLYRVPAHDVTPTMVADALERLVARAQG